MGALDGLLVVALEQAVAAPFASCRLADAGARVIKIERAEGDFARGYDRAAAGMSSYFAWLNRGKESVTLDIKTPGDADLLHRLVAAADVFVQNLAPGAAARAGFGSAELRARHPRLVTCDISGYGEAGAYRDMKAYDLLIQAETGLASVTGAPEAPGRVGVSICDIAAGATAYAAILEALIRRERTGVGEALAVSLFDVTADWMTVPLLHHDYLGAAPRRTGLTHPSIAPYGVYPTRGTSVLIAIQNEREWQRFCATVLGDPSLASRPEFTDNVSRVAHRAALDQAIGRVFTSLEVDELRARLRAADIAFGSANGVAELSRHPQLRRTSVESPVGPIRLVAPPVRRGTDGDGPTLRPVPEVGADTDRVRREFGVAPDRADGRPRR